MSRFYDNIGRGVIEGYAKISYGVRAIFWHLFGIAALFYVSQWIWYYFKIARHNEKLYNVWDIYEPALWTTGIIVVIYLIGMLIIVEG